MSSTDGAAAEERLQRFFDDELMPAARALRQARGELFPTHPDPDAATYWAERSPRTMAREGFEVAGLESIDKLETALRDLWQARGLPQLAALSCGIVELARLLKQGDDESDEVSPFIYVMF